MRENLIMDILLAGCIALLATAFIVAFAVLLFGDQEYYDNTGDLTCKEIRECILIDVGCVETTIKNSFLGSTWFVEHNFLSDQKQYYKKHCMEVEA